MQETQYPDYCWRPNRQRRSPRWHRRCIVVEHQIDVRGALNRDGRILPVVGVQPGHSDIRIEDRGPVIEPDVGIDLPRALQDVGIGMDGDHDRIRNRRVAESYIAGTCRRIAVADGRTPVQGATAVLAGSTEILKPDRRQGRIIRR